MVASLRWAKFLLRGWLIGVAMASGVGDLAGASPCIEELGRRGVAAGRSRVPFDWRGHGASSIWLGAMVPCNPLATHLQPTCPH